MSAMDAVREFYNSTVEREWERLDRHPVEYAITAHYLKRYIKPGQKVLDIGGGPGRYSLMLAEFGCDVTLLDLSPVNTEYALQKAKERGLQIAVLPGDAREADRLVSGPFDAVLNMGPLYHLQTGDDRDRSVAACRNLLRDGGILFASIITLQAGMLYYLDNDPSLILLDQEESYLRALEQDVSYTGRTFTESHFMRAEELCPLMERHGFISMHKVACEGVCAPRETEILRSSPEVLRRWIELSLKLCERSEFMGMAEHILYVGRKVI